MVLKVLLSINDIIEKEKKQKPSYRMKVFYPIFLLVKVELI